MNMSLAGEYQSYAKFSLYASWQIRNSIFAQFLDSRSSLQQQPAFLMILKHKKLLTIFLLSEISPYRFQSIKDQNMWKTLLVCLAIWSGLTFKPCQPFGTRIFYGEVVKIQASQEKLQIFFNTAEECSQSYVQIIKKTGMERIKCTTKTLQLSANVKNYQTSIHKCSISSVDFEQLFHYNAFGWDGSSANPIPFSVDFIPVSITDVTDSKRKINLITLADWSALDKNKDKYAPLDGLFASVMEKQEINGVMIGGDVGYDLDTNNCLNYESFLVMLSKVATTVPVIMVTGNHQYNTEDNYKLFQASFQMYNLDTELATHIELGPLYILPFDPFQILLGKKVTKDPCIDKFLSVMGEAKKSNKFILPTSHYPLACSGTSKNCKNDRKDMSTYWNAMFDAGVSLYIGAHYHTYQRAYPYLKDNTFSLQAANYRSNEDYIISIVQGVAGNDKDIVEAIDTIEDFTASYTINETGFGVLEIDEKGVKYVHYSTARGETDRISIARSASSGNLMRE